MYRLNSIEKPLGLTEPNRPQINTTENFRYLLVRLITPLR